MKISRWLTGALVLAGAVALIVLRPLPFLFYPDLPHLALLGRALYIIVLAGVICLYRIARGPTAADRIVAIDILGILIVGLCALLAVATGRPWYVDIGIAWALQSFIGALALSKYLEGKQFDE